MLAHAGGVFLGTPTRSSQSNPPSTQPSGGRVCHGSYAPLHMSSRNRDWEGASLDSFLAGSAGAADASHIGGTDWPALITAIAALVAALLAATALVIEGRRTRLQLGLNNLWRLIEQWDGPQMRLRRAHLASHLLSKPSARSTISDEAIDVLNTFELLAFLVVRSRTLRLEDAWVNFSPWALSWWFVLKSGVDRLREPDETVFEDYAQLIEQFIEYEMKRRKVPRDAIIPTEDDLREFLNSEARLPGRLVEDDVSSPAIWYTGILRLLSRSRVK